MGMDSIWHWMILLVVVLLIFGTSKISKVGGDLGSAIKGFKRALHDDKSDRDDSLNSHLDSRPKD
jgi:sec-independent protein translocase protein TatA